MSDSWEREEITAKFGVHSMVDVGHQTNQHTGGMCLKGVGVAVLIGAAALAPNIDVPPSRQCATELQAHKSRSRGTQRVDFDHERDLKDDGGQEDGISMRYPSIAECVRGLMDTKC